MVASIPGIKSGVRQSSNDKTNVAVLWRCQHGSLSVSRGLRCNSLRGNAKRPRYYSSHVSVEWRNSVYIWPSSCCKPSYVHGAVPRDIILSITIQRGCLLISVLESGCSRLGLQCTDTNITVRNEDCVEQ